MSCLASISYNRNTSPNAEKSLCDTINPQSLAHFASELLAHFSPEYSSSSGRDQQQTLLLLAYMYANLGAVLLLDEPDAHLEILRQRQIYQVLTQTAAETNSQIIAASHSEVLLNEAADRDIVIAFVGKPHRIDDRGSQVLKSKQNPSPLNQNDLTFAVLNAYRAVIKGDWEILTSYQGLILGRKGFVMIWMDWAGV
jgi:ABC-type glutathione transport system ATPase component